VKKKEAYIILLNIEGKSMLLTHAANHATMSEMKVILTEADSIDKETPYLLWYSFLFYF